MSAREDMIAGRYRLISRLGAGGMGVVWEAWDERLERRVAAKQLRVPPGLSEVEAEIATQRAMREARTTAKLHHRHAVSVFDVVDDDGQPCLIMQFVPSVTLAAVLQEGGPLQVHEAAQVGAEVASALSAAHRLGIVHRDVKPANILIADDGSALISDFGISRALGDTTLTSTGLVHGTPAYLPPEVARGEEADFASDVFSLGATLYAALEGAPPFGTDTNSLALLHRVAAGEFEPPRQAGPLTPVLLRMLSREPSSRPDMREVANTLAGLTSSEMTDRSIPAPVAAESPPVQSVPSPPVVASAGPTWSLTGEAAPGQPPGRRRRTALWAVPVVVLVAVGVLVALLAIPRLGGPGAGAVVQPPGDPSPTAGSSIPARSQQPTASGQPTSGQQSTVSEQPTSSRSASPPEPAPRRSASLDPTPAEPSTTESSASPQGSSSAPTRRRSPEANSSLEARLRAGVTRYYGLMPENTAEGWPLMTADYKANTARSRQSYERFWSDFERVTVRGLTAIPPDRARATIVYYYKDGRVMTELTSIRLAEEDGIFKLDDHTVLSSVTR
jgi:eukaryotic-like serine/threonine-protein kinase